MIRREVVREKVVHVAGGQQYRLRRGDIVALFPLLSPQMDPEIHQEPQVDTVHDPRFKHVGNSHSFIFMKVATQVLSVCGVVCSPCVPVASPQ